MEEHDQRVTAYGQNRQRVVTCWTRQDGMACTTQKGIEHGPHVYVVRNYEDVGHRFCILSPLSAPPASRG
jgi:hypothetical protein